jgi:hypothetical protein
MIDMIGRQFGRWTVLATSAPRRREAYWLCRCSCGAERAIQGSSLRSGGSKSCGCLSAELAGDRARKYGGRCEGRSGKEYFAWSTARRRCEDKDNAGWKRYGGRGIAMCPEWRDNFPQFLADMGTCPPNHSLDRRDNDGPYSPENCRWATWMQQSRNRRTNRLISHEGETLCLTDWAARTGVSPQVIHWRLRRGWSVAEAFSHPRKYLKNVAPNGASNGAPLQEGV